MASAPEIQTVEQAEVQNGSVAITFQPICPVAAGGI